MSNIIKTEEFEQDGSIYIREIYDSGTIVEIPKPQEHIGYIQPTSEPYQPTNAVIAQMISDLQADLIIAGVL